MLRALARGVGLQFQELLVREGLPNVKEWADSISKMSTVHYATYKRQGAFFGAEMPCNLHVMFTYIRDRK
jgi:hypothetical protein